MATRCFIARYDEETEFYDAIYCHWDGYPEGVGLTLRDHYKSDEKVQFLIANGDISSLRETVVETKEEAYRLRGDSDVDAKPFRFLSEMEEHYRGCWCEYGYVWKHGKWACLSLNPGTVNLYTLERETADA